MINRRRVIQSLLSVTAGCAVVHCQTVFGKLPSPESQTGEASRSLIELLRDAAQLCQQLQDIGLPADQRTFVETQELCLVAISRLQQSTLDTPAFWQNCSDAVSRLESAVSLHSEAIAAEIRFSSDTLGQLRSLKKQLAIQTVQAIGISSRLG